MAYTRKNFRTKKALRGAFENGEELAVYQPGSSGPEVLDGTAWIEGPHEPDHHTWGAEVIVAGGVIVKFVK